METKVAFITGGSKGIGLGIAEELIKNNIKVAITGRNAVNIKEAELHLNTIVPDSALGLSADVRNYNSMSRA